MLDINLIRTNPQLIKKDLEKRFQGEKKEFLDNIIHLDKRYREILQELEELRHERNVISQNINLLRKENKPFHKELERAQSLPKEILKLEREVNLIKERINENLLRIPNISHKTVPKGVDEKDNAVVKKWGKIKKSKFKLEGHEDLGVSLGLLDIERAAKISGARFYFLKGELAILDLAIMRLAIDYMTKKKYQLIIPPHMIRRKPYEGVVDLNDFQEMLYKIENEDLYMIATSEHPLTARFMNEILNKKDLPIRNTGFSTNFRKEAGAHGKDTKGIFRVHQFNKVEQIVLCEPKDSWKIHEELIKNIEGFFKLLKIPFRIVNICSGDLGTVAAKKYDLEAWMPVQNTYREMGSCSNCTDYQARRLNIKFRDKPGEASRDFIHTLNSTLVTDRALVAILENYQQKNRNVKIPKVLWKYTGFKEIKH
jgi:seryl-tRNA synthetase